MQKNLDAYPHRYNHERSHQGRGMDGRAPYQAFIAGLPKKEKTEKKATPRGCITITRQGRGCQANTISVHENERCRTN